MALTPENSAALAAEINDATGPLFAQYGAIRNDAALDQAAKATQIANLINSLDTNRTVVRESMTGREVRSAIDPADFTALTDAKRQAWLILGGYDDIDPRNGSKDVELVKWIFGSGSNTVASLASLRNQVVSRASEIGLPSISPADVIDAGVV